MNPLLKYKEYHKNPTNIFIHQLCVPILLLSGYAMFPQISCYVNGFYTINYLLFDVFSKKSIQLAVLLQFMLGGSYLLNQLCSFETILTLHGVGWAVQLAGHKVYEKNTPAFLDNLYDSFLFAPYFLFLETFYPNSFLTTDPYEIIHKTYDANLPSIIYFAGLFQKSNKQFNFVVEQLPGYNHIFVNVHFKLNDIFSIQLENIVKELGDKVKTIECAVGFSFGGALAKKTKYIIEKYSSKEIKTILISPGGFRSNTFLGFFIKNISCFLFCIYKTDKWYMISEYPLYQNNTIEDDMDIFIESKDDWIHSPKKNKTTDSNSIVIKNVSHSNIISVVKRQKMIQRLVESDYNIKSVNVRHLSSLFTKVVFGSHFYPYHIGLWCSVSAYNFYSYLYRYKLMYPFFIGGVFASTTWTFTEYIFHRYLLHSLFYVHHKKHHDYPNKQSIIHTPMALVVMNWFIYWMFFKHILEDSILTSYAVFFPLNYLLFEYTHWISHSYVGKNNIILNAKNFHRLHHFTPDTNYSFVTPYWDYLFGTLHPEYKISFLELLLGFLPFYSFTLHKYTKTTTTSKTHMHT